MPAPDIPTRGKIQTVSFDGDARPTLDVYVTGPSSGEPETSTIVVATDIYGIEGGQVKQVCDALAESVGARVLLVDFFRGNACTAEIRATRFVEWVKGFDQAGVEADFARAKEVLAVPGTSKFGGRVA